MESRIMGASIQGATHKRVQKECQDSRGSLVLDNAIIVAVADGHGSSSCPFSKTGSSVAVNVFIKIMSGYCLSYSNDMQTFLTYLNREGDTTVARAIDNEWKRRIEIAHKNNKREVKTDGNGNLDKSAIWKQYGSTLLGLVITPTFYFAFQLGDGDIVRLNDEEANFAVKGDKLLGTETHSLSSFDAWKKSITMVARRGNAQAFMLSTDGFANSYPDDASFLQTCRDYYSAIRQHGIDVISKKLKHWLNETSENGSGDDITALFII